MYSVLLPVDDQTERAMLAADAVVDLPNAAGRVEVTLLNVFEEFEVSGEGKVRSEDIWDDTSYPDSVLEVEEYLESAGIEVTKRRVHGEPADRIIAVAEEIGPDAIFMSGRGRSPTGKALFGSVTQSVLLASDYPVTITLAE